MRILIAAIVVCALGAPLASAMPFARPGATLSQRSPQVLDIKAKAKSGKSTHASRGKKGGAGGIHPLVGSGDY